MSQLWLSPTVRPGWGSFSRPSSSQAFAWAHGLPLIPVNHGGSLDGRSKRGAFRVSILALLVSGALLRADLRQ